MKSPHSILIGAAALIVGLAVTMPLYRTVRTAEAEAARQAFEQRAHELARFVEDRFSDYEQALRSGAALFAVDGAVNRAQWRDFVSVLELEQHYPGTQGFGFAQWLWPEQVAAHEARVRADGFPDYRLHPDGLRDGYSVILYLEPFDARNRRAFGFDMYSEPVRRQAMERARDSGEATLTGKVFLVQETEVDRQNGALLYLPVYRGSGVPDSVEARRQRLRGFIYSPLRMDDLVQGILGASFQDLRLSIYDGASPSAEGLLFGSPQADTADEPGLRIALEIAGRTWLLQVDPAAPLAATPGRAAVILQAGLVITALIALLLAAFAGARDRARVLADRMSRAYREAQQMQKAVLDSVPDGVLAINARGVITSANPAAEKIFATAPGGLLDRDIGHLISDHGRILAGLSPVGASTAASTHRTETEAVASDGRRFPVELTISPSVGSAEGAAFVESVRDISERKRAQAMLAEAHGLRESILTHSPFSIVATDASAVITEMNPAAERLLWYRRDELVGKATLRVFLDPSEIALVLPAVSPPSETTEQQIEAVLAKAKRGHVDEREWTYVRKDGSRVLVNQVLTALRDNEGGLIGYLAIAYDITERKRAEDYIRHLAHHDALTELPNRALFKDRLDVAIAQARRGGGKVGVVMVDLDHFKRINDSLGHHVGDELLIQLTARLRNCVREGDTVARMGGDEFVIVLPDLHGADDAVRVARSVVDIIDRPVRVGIHELHVTPSVGVCLYPEDGQDSMTLLKNADTAMYHAKEHGRNGYSMFSFDMLRASEEKMELESALRRAVSEHSLQLFYQPLVSAPTGRVVGMEALLRWRRPDGSQVPPDVFIPIAEDTGLIGQIGEDLVRAACRDARRLSQLLGRPLDLAVNVSPQQFHHQNLTEQIREALDDSGFDPAHLALEITERVLVRDPVEAAETLGRLRALGVGVAIDDFGTGYSSLAYISQFPISKLKIDRSFVRDLGTDSADTAVINAVIAMGHSLGLTVIAEGVETPAQFDYLKGRGCDEVQGFLFSPGVAADEFEAVVRRIETAAVQIAAVDTQDQIAADAAS